MFWCNHKWVVKEKTVLPSMIEQAGQAGGESIRSKGGDPSKKPCIVHYKCEKCGTETVERV